MSYLVLARKCRPQQFAEILGQDHVTRTLTNALRSGRIAHAFLFTGARGVGKTSAARILAKALCCANGDGPTATPCGACSMCTEIAEGNATDVFEIDAASNTGVANVREIIDNVRYLPSKARFKIYIIDEVHMLSTGAFNALLKTLEEPPPHVKFILATTDVHRIPVTILSRCQRYDFRRIPLDKMAERLSGILEAERIEHDPSAMMLVARETEGSMRDAQSLLEQVLTFADGRRLDASLTREALGLADRAALAEIVAAVVGRQPGRVLEVIKDVHDRGLDLKRFGDALVEYVRDLLVARLLDDPSRVLDRPRDEVVELVARAGKIDAVMLERVFEQMCSIVESVGESSFPRFQLEVGLASLAEAPPRVAVDALLEKLDRVEAALVGRPSAHGHDVRPPAAPGGAAPRPFRNSAVEPPANPPAAKPGNMAAPASSPKGPAPSESKAAAPAAPSRLASPEPAKKGPGDFASFVDLVKQRRPTLSGSLAHVRPSQFEPGEVVLGCRTAFDAETLGAEATVRWLSDLLGQYFGVPTRLQVVRAEAAPVAENGPQTLEEIALSAREAERQERMRKIRSHPVVRAIRDELGGEISRVRVIDDA